MIRIITNVTSSISVARFCCFSSLLLLAVVDSSGSSSSFDDFISESEKEQFIQKHDLQTNIQFFESQLICNTNSNNRTNNGNKFVIEEGEKTYSFLLTKNELSLIQVFTEDAICIIDNNLAECPDNHNNSNSTPPFSSAGSIYEKHVVIKDHINGRGKRGTITVTFNDSGHHDNTTTNAVSASSVGTTLETIYLRFNDDEEEDSAANGKGNYYYAKIAPCIYYRITSDMLDPTKMNIQEQKLAKGQDVTMKNIQHHLRYRQLQQEGAVEVEQKEAAATTITATATNGITVDNSISNTQQPPGCSSYKIATIAVAFDSTFCSSEDKNERKAIFAIQKIVSMASLMFEQQGVCVKLRIGHLEGFCNPNDDPFVEGLSISSNIGCSANVSSSISPNTNTTNLLDWFTNYWKQNHADSVSVDAVHLFYHQDLDGDGIGCATYFDFCDHAYSVNSMDFSHDEIRRATLFARELAHNFGMIRGDAFTDKNKYGIMDGSPRNGNQVWLKNDLNDFRSVLDMFDCLSSEEATGIASFDTANNSTNSTITVDRLQPFSIHSLLNNLCLTVIDSITENGAVPQMMPCVDATTSRRRQQIIGTSDGSSSSSTGSSQLWIMDKEGRLHTAANYNACLQPDAENNVLWMCNTGDNRQRWTWEPEAGILRTTHSHECMSTMKENEEPTKVLACSLRDPQQMWKQVQISKDEEGGERNKPSAGLVATGGEIESKKELAGTTTTTPPIFHIQSKATESCLAVISNYSNGRYSILNGDEPSMIPCNNTNTFQFWSMDDRGYIHSVANYMKCIQQEPISRVGGTSVTGMEDCQMYNNDQKWIWDDGVVGAGSSHHSNGLIQSKGSEGFCLSTEYSLTGKEKNVIEYVQLVECKAKDSYQCWNQIPVSFGKKDGDDSQNHETLKEKISTNSSKSWKESQSWLAPNKGEEKEQVSSVDNATKETSWFDNAFIALFVAIGIMMLAFTLCWFNKSSKT